MVLSGCGTANTGAPSLDSAGKHPQNWLSGHRAAYLANTIQCRECHGADLKGGITKVDCFNQGALARCHSNGHGPRSIIHPLPFASSLLHGSEAAKDLIVCQSCHGTPGSSGSNPQFNVRIGSLASGCELSGCHIQKMAHPKSWNSHGTSGNQANSCALCHGANFSGGNGPSCKSCHARLATGGLPIKGQCSSCHGNPPSGSLYPDRIGSHARHTALSGVTCSACHNGFGSGSHSHYSSARVQQLQLSAKMGFMATYNARNNSANFNTTTNTCANIKCHGGQTTPIWGATLDSLTECRKCHSAGSTQYNGYLSDTHFHLDPNFGLFCTDCHDMTSQVAPNHFSNLSSISHNQPASRTIRSFLNYDKTTQPPTCFIASGASPGANYVSCHRAE